MLPVLPAAIFEPSVCMDSLIEVIERIVNGFAELDYPATKGIIGIIRVERVLIT